MSINSLHLRNSSDDTSLFWINFGEKYLIMEFGICLLPVIPLRKEPNERSEMLTQMIFGETARIFEKNKKWVSVETDMDHYPGWVDFRQIELITAREYERIIKASLSLTTEPFTAIRDDKDIIRFLPIASSLPGLKDNTVSLGKFKFYLQGQKTLPFSKRKVENVLKLARTFLNAPYLWGGRTHMGLDCSGFTQAVFRLNGISLPRDASQQSGIGQVINLVTEALPGDLAFFDNDEGMITHVGLILDSTSIIHASGKVRIDALDHQGIYNVETNKYSHRLRLIRRIME